jgi:L-arabinonolactonase
MAIGLTVPNLLAFSADGESMYFCDTLRRVIWLADIRPKDGALIGIEEFIRLEPGVTSDGATVDSQDGYWVANFGGSEIRRYFSNGVLDRVFSMPTSQPTKPVFGGEDLKKIYVTSTQIVAPDFPASGCNGAVVELDVDIPGLPENYFEG